MHIIKSIALACAALCATQANALDNATMNNVNTFKVFVSGASALAGSVGGLFTQNCAPGTLTTYTQTGNATFGTIYSCSLNAVNDFNFAATTANPNRNVMFQKRDAGGSGVGVYPVSNNTAIAFIDPTTCTGSASGTGTCTGQFNRTADGGVSDVEPAMFAATQNTPPESVGSAVGNLSTSQPINQTIFGLAVSNVLYTALQTQQGLTAAQRPTISQAVAGQMLRNNFPSDPISWKLLLPNATPAVQNSQVTICRRLNGSGTQAAANRFFLEYPFNSGTSQEPLTAVDSTATAHGPGNVFPAPAGIPTNLLYVVENSATADARNCMTAANTAGGFALGHISLENLETAAWKFVRIGGQEPSRDEARNGRYAYMFESTGQTSTAAPSAVQAFVNAFFVGAGLPVNLAALSAANQNGVLARPQSPVCPNVFGATTYSAPDTLTGAVPAAVTTFCSRVTRNGNSAEFPGFFR
jgi:hypothetical protein